MANPNILTSSQITGNIERGALTTGLADMLSNGVGTGIVYKVVSILLSNSHGAATANASIQISEDDNGNVTTLCKSLNIPYTAAVILIDKNSPLYIMEDMKILILIFILLMKRYHKYA